MFDKVKDLIMGVPKNSCAPAAHKIKITISIFIPNIGAFSALYKNRSTTN